FLVLAGNGTEPPRRWFAAEVHEFFTDPKLVEDTYESVQLMLVSEETWRSIWNVWRDGYWASLVNSPLSCVPLLKWPPPEKSLEDDHKSLLHRYHLRYLRPRRLRLSSEPTGDTRLSN
ncbi:hypothetical protein PENTCL1PPCAC_25527, partial [Pristionchus entomophagus]